MKIQFYFLMCLFVALLSCEDEKDLLIKPDTYHGIFYRTIDGVQQEISSVTLVLKDNAFEGGSTVQYYPAIGKGTYSISENIINFHDESPWLAHFNWSFILKGEFTITYTEDQLILKKDIGTSAFDIYVFNLSTAE